jgi:hypothetical protein
VIVDAVTEVLRVQNSAIEGPSSMLAQGNSDYLRGIAKLSDRLIILLDLNKLLSSKAESDAIAKLLTESVSNARDEDHEPVIALKNGNGKKKAVEASKGNNNKEPAVV